MNSKIGPLALCLLIALCPIAVWAETANIKAETTNRKAEATHMSAEAEPSTPSEPSSATAPEVPVDAKEPAQDKEPAQSEDTQKPVPTPIPHEPEATAAPSDASVHAQRIRVSLSSDLVFPGDSFQAKSEVIPANASQEVSWSSSSTIIHIDSSGKAQVEAPLSLSGDGVSVDIWARATDGSLAMNCQTIRVMPAATRLSFFEDALTLNRDAQSKVERVMIELVPAELYGLSIVEWTSSDSSVVSVSAEGMNGEVGVLHWTNTEGTAVITARVADNLGASDQVLVSVASPIQ